MGRPGCVSAITFVRGGRPRRGASSAFIQQVPLVVGPTNHSPFLSLTGRIPVPSLTARRRVAGGSRHRDGGTPAMDAGPRFALLDTTVIDGSGAPPTPHTAVVVDGQDISTVVPMSAYRREAEVQEIDAGGLYVLPGLIDAHVHLAGCRAGKEDQELGALMEPPLARAVRSVSEAQALLKRGFTSIARHLLERPLPQAHLPRRLPRRSARDRLRPGPLPHRRPRRRLPVRRRVRPPQPLLGDCRRRS